MYSKIAIGNVKKSFKDYSIYFLTLTLAVSIFYSFNSIESQKAMLEMNSSQAQYMEVMTGMISLLSGFVSVILGSLILYANNFLIKKRKKELGIYMSLGMSKRKISKILMLETLIVGIISLVSGILLGLILSQGLSVFTSKLFDVAMSEYKFMVSLSSIKTTIMSFAVMFLIVMIFNVFVISRYKIIDLLVSSRKNENIKFKNPLIYLITFILCVISLVVAYKMVIETGLNPENPKFITSIALGVLGTLLFFYSLAGAGLYIFKNTKNIYFKDLNIFIIKQINSKVNTNFLSMSVICLMLFLTMGILSTGISFKNALESGLEETTPFDASATSYLDEGENKDYIENSLKAIGFKFDESEEYVYYNEYKSNLEMNELNKDLNKENKAKIKNIGQIEAYLIKESEFNNIRKLNNKDEIVLKEDEILITSNQAEVINILNDFLEENDKIKIEDKIYKIKNSKAIEDSLESTGLSSNIFTIIVDDKMAKDLKPITSKLNVNFTGDKKKSENKFASLFIDYKEGNIDYDKVGFVNGYTKEQLYEENKGMTTTILFVGIYLGIIFLISSMAVLALQQLSEASDSIDRYKSLKRIGANDKMINKTIFIQTLIYFSIPIGLAFVHSVVGIKVANDFISMFNKPDIAGSSLMTTIIFMVVYLGYFYATYSGYKNIVKNS